MQGTAGRAAVRNEYLLRIVKEVFLPAGDFGGLGLDLVHKVIKELVDGLGLFRGKTPDVMVEAGHIVAVHPAEVGHGEPAVLTGQVGVIVDPGLHRGTEPLHHGQFAGFRHIKTLAHVAHHLVEQQDHRGAVGFRHIEAFHRHGKDVLHRRGGQHDDRMVAVHPPPGLIHVALRHLRGQARGRPTALHAGHHAGDFPHDRVTKGLLHERKTGAAGRGHGLVPSHRRRAHGA